MYKDGSGSATLSSFEASMQSCNGMNVFIRTGQTLNFDHVITGTLTAYATPQVILRYNTIVCPTTDTDKPKCDQGVSVFSYWSIRKC